ncbi:hypothetical protein EVAR_19751_1 [Eumeta japonica]|uniref:Uncharacterized protein n=1 Tax=Eumeta variegata TaxID=151549 RepID=A0A4C1UR73_EUMVA|nr:hypothetical protein EVAR_19751_1 [Eumeta japonica]
MAFAFITVTIYRLLYAFLCSKPRPGQRTPPSLEIVQAFSVTTDRDPSIFMRAAPTQGGRRAISDEKCGLCRASKTPKASTYESSRVQASDVPELRDATSMSKPNCPEIAAGESTILPTAHSS